MTKAGAKKGLSADAREQDYPRVTGGNGSQDADAATYSAGTAALDNTSTWQANLEVRGYDAASGDILEGMEYAFFLQDTNEPVPFKQNEKGYLLTLPARHAMVRIESKVGKRNSGYKPQWPRMMIWAKSNAHCCTVPLPMIPSTSRQAETTRLKLYVCECEQECDGVERRRQVNGRVTVTEMQPFPSENATGTGAEYQKETSNGCAEFSLIPDRWYSIQVQGRSTHSGAAMQFFACHGDCVEFTVCCKPLVERSLRLCFEDEYQRPCSNFTFQIKGREYCSDEKGECVLSNPALGNFTIATLAPVQIKPSSIIIGSADEQTVRVLVTQQVQRYLLTFAVEDFIEVREQVRIAVIDPASSSMLHELQIDAYGRAQCYVDELRQYQAQLKINNQTMQVQHVTPLISEYN